MLRIDPDLLDCNVCILVETEEEEENNIKNNSIRMK